MRRLGWPLFAFALVACFKEKTEEPVRPETATEQADETTVLVAKTPPCKAVSRTPAITPMPSGDSAGTLALVRSSGHTIAIAADEDDRSLAMMDIDAHTLLGITKLAGKPSKLIATPDGRIIVALSDKSALEVLEPETEKPFPLTHRCLVDVPAEPVGLARTPDQTTLLVVSRWGHTLSSLQLDDLSAKQMIELPRDPTAVLPSSDGKKAFITHAAGGLLSVVDLQTEDPKPRSTTIGSVFFANPNAEMMPMMPMKPPPKAFPSTSRQKKVRSTATVKHHHIGTQAFSLVRTEKGKIMAPLVLTEPAPPPGVPSGYGSADSAAPAAVGEVAVFDENSEAVAITKSPQSIGPKDCFLPRAAAMDEKRGELWVTCLGIDSVVVYDANKKHPHAYEKNRIHVPAGPTGIVIDAEGQRAVVFSQFDAAITVISMAEPPIGSKNPRTEQTSLVLTDRQGLAPELALGRSLFHAAGKRRISIDGRACASCHPDGRDDGLTWGTQEGPRQTPILLGRLVDSAPFGWLGDKEDLPSHFARTLSRLSGTGLKPEERDAIFAWVKSLTPPRAKPTHDESILARGKTLFESEEAACASCHQGETSTDGDKHDVASKTKFEIEKDFETPSLRFIARSAPYFHDGRYPTLVEMLKGSDGAMGKTSHLAENDLEALAAYVESL